MIDWNELNNFFDNVIVSDSNPFHLNYTETYKVGSNITSKEVNEIIELYEVKSPLELIINNKNIEQVNYYPKNIFQKLFKKRPEIKFDGDETNFILLSDNLKDIFKTNCLTYNLNEDNKVVIGKKGRLIIMEESGKIFANINDENYRTIIVK